jgi:hypothetical protein
MQDLRCDFENDNFGVRSVGPPLIAVGLNSPEPAASSAISIVELGIFFISVGAFII